MLTAKQNQKFPFHFFFRFAAEGWGEEAREKCKEIFWSLHTQVRERVRGAHHWSSGFNSKYIRTSFNTHRQFTISAFWGDVASRLRRSAGALRAPKSHFARICHAPRGEKETAWFWIWKFVWAKPKVPQSGTNQSFSFCRKRNMEAIIFNILTA